MAGELLTMVGLPAVDDSGRLGLGEFFFPSGPGLDSFSGVQLEPFPGPDAVISYVFRAPPTITGTALRADLIRLANASNGAVAVEFAWSVAADDDWSQQALDVEPTANLNWNSSRINKAVQVSAALAASTLPVALDYVLMELRFLAAGSDLLVPSLWSLQVRFE